MYSDRMKTIYGKDPNIYGRLKYSRCLPKGEFETLPNIMVVTQQIIDGLIEKKNKRIAVILPDDSSDVYSLIIAKCIRNIKYKGTYSGDILHNIESGQKLRLGEGIVEFEEIYTKNNIERRYIVQSI